MNPKGNIWLAVGTSDTGKTHTVMELANKFATRQNVPKSILVFDHTNNSSYDPYGLTNLTFEDLPYLHPDEIIKGIVRHDDIDTFCKLATLHLQQCSVIFDDCGVQFKGNLTKPREAMLKTRKNNGTELIFQTHTFREISPSLLDQTTMYILKETIDDPEDLPQKVNAKRELEHLLIEIIRENIQLPENKKWATRIYDPQAYMVWVLDLAKNKYHIQSGNDYFPFSNKRRYGL